MFLGAAGLVEEVYWPGRRRRLVGAPGADNVAPTVKRVRIMSGKCGKDEDGLVVLVNPWRHCPATQTTVEEDDGAVRRKTTSLEFRKSKAITSHSPANAAEAKARKDNATDIMADNDEEDRGKEGGRGGWVAETPVRFYTLPSAF